MRQWCSSTQFGYMCYCILWTCNYWVSSYNRPYAFSPVLGNELLRFLATVFLYICIHRSTSPYNIYMKQILNAFICAFAVVCDGLIRIILTLCKGIVSQRHIINVLVAKGEQATQTHWKLDLENHNNTKYMKVIAVHSTNIPKYYIA